MDGGASSHGSRLHQPLRCKAKTKQLDRHFLVCLQQHARRKSVRLTAPAGDSATYGGFSHPGNYTVVMLEGRTKTRVCLERFQGRAGLFKRRLLEPEPRSEPSGIFDFGRALVTEQLVTL